MIYSKAHKYIKQQVESVLPNPHEHKDVFNVDNVASSIISKKDAYHIGITFGGQERQDQSIDTTLSCAITLFYKAGKDVQREYLEALDISSDVVRSCSSLSAMYAFRSTDNYPIQRANIGSVETEPFDTNDNSFKIIISMELLIDESIC